MLSVLFILSLFIGGLVLLDFLAASFGVDSRQTNANPSGNSLNSYRRDR